MPKKYVKADHMDENISTRSSGLQDSQCECAGTQLLLSIQRAEFCSTFFSASIRFGTRITRQKTRRKERCAR